MSDIKYRYAKNIDGNFVNVLNAKKNEYYYLQSETDTNVQMLPVQGESLQWHFRSKVKGLAIGMTAEHINLQAKICFDLNFYCKHLDLHIKAFSSKPEYTLSNGRRVDVAYFDENNDILCGIEVVHSNDISPEKYKDLYNSNYLIFKVYTYDQERFIFISNIEIDREKFRILEQLKIIESRHRNSEGSYFDRLKAVKSKLIEAQTEEGELIRDIEQITKQINTFFI